MSFSLEFHARSREHARRLLDLQSSYVPTPVLSFLKTAIDNVPPLRDGFSRVFHVKAFGHLCNGDYAVSSATINVTPIDIAD